MIRYQDPMAQLIQGDCREVSLAGIDAIVTDPPYELAFMGKSWDKAGIAFDSALWKQMLDACKPGAHLLAFGIGRTHHRLMTAIEDAGWEIRDCIYWVFGSGFPKSLDVSKAIDKKAGAERGVIRDGFTSSNEQGNTYAKGLNARFQDRQLTAPATPEAIRWSGFGTALKPAVEIIVMARRPLEKGLTVAQNVLKYGTGALNIDASRVGTEERLNKGQAIYHGNTGTFSGQGEIPTRVDKQVQGRFPANLIHDGSEEVLAEFAKAGVSVGTGMSKEKSGQGCWPYGSTEVSGYKDSGTPARFFKCCPWAEEDIPSLFYAAKASRRERDRGLEGMEDNPAPYDPETKGGAGLRIGRYDEQNPRRIAPVKNDHATVKPLSLMRYLITLITPPNGTVFDPFAGSGSTLVAARQLGFRSIGIELDAHYCEIAKRRIQARLGEIALPMRLE